MIFTEDPIVCFDEAMRAHDYARAARIARAQEQKSETPIHRGKWCLRLHEACAHLVSVAR
jgi:hypothetical protein